MSKKKKMPPNLGFGPTLESGLWNAAERLDRAGGTGKNYRSTAHSIAPILRSMGIQDVSEIRKHHLYAIGTFAREQIIEAGQDDPESINGRVGTWSNKLSHMNQLLLSMYGRQKVWVAPSKAIGLTRTGIRTQPVTCCQAAINTLADELIAEGFAREASIMLLARHLGLRLREAILLRPQDALKQLAETGLCRIYWGTKGGVGKHIERLVPPPLDLLCLEVALQTCRDHGALNLIPADVGFKSVYFRAERVLLPRLKMIGIRCIHDLRAAYACDAMFALTHCDPPIVVREDPPVLSLIDTPIDTKQAKGEVSQRLGHLRIRVINSYCGRV